MSSDRYHQYAADCVRMAESEASPEAKTVMQNMALCWVRLAQQKEVVAAALAPDSELPSLEPATLEQVGPAEHKH